MRWRRRGGNPTAGFDALGERESKALEGRRTGEGFLWAGWKRRARAAQLFWRRCLIAAPTDATEGGELKSRVLAGIRIRTRNMTRRQRQNGGRRDYEMKALWEAVVVGQGTGMKREEEEENEAATGTRGSGASEDR